MTINSTLLAKAIHCSFMNENIFLEFDHVSIDSRSLQNGSHTLFFCLKGHNHDAHQYIESLIQKGVANFVVEYIPDVVKNKAHFYIVENTTVALQELAQHYKSEFKSLQTIAITGSNGKTIVKEWLNFLLSPDYAIVRSPKSYNSQVGVPLSVFGINEKHNLGIFEAGISQHHEMALLEKIIQPSIGIFTHLGDAHNEGFTSIEEKVKEKTKLFNRCKIVILEKNDFVEKHISAPTFTWSFDNPSANVFVVYKVKNNQQTNLKLQVSNHKIEINLPFTDDISIENAMTCIATLVYLKVDFYVIQKRIAELYAVEIRLQAKKGINNCLLIDDSFSSDYQSLKIALDFLDQQKVHSKKSIILSDIFQSGLDVDQLYHNVTKALESNKINRIITIGETISKHLEHLPNVISFSTTQAFLQQFNTQSFQNETILVKGARSFHFDEIVVLLEEKKHETILEINLDAITYNLNFYKSKLKPETKVMVMVKAFGYGNGGYELAKHLEFLKTSYLGVAFADEGVELRKAGITMPIMIMNPETSSFNTMIAYQLEPEIYSLNALKSFIKISKEKNVSAYPIHLKLDTGMHRQGFEAHDIPELITILRQSNFVKVTSIFSHLAASDELNFKDFTLLQINRYQQMAEEIKSKLGIQPIEHLLNTSGIFNFSEYQFNMVRLGIGLYGVGNSKEENQLLQQVSTLKSIILQIREVTPKESIGYGRKFMVNEPIRVATVPIGYADGIRRAWGNEKGYVTIHNQKARILGNICMDMLMVDVTHIPCQEQDEVIIFGHSPTVIEMAQTLQTIPYEILTSISQRVKRIFYKNG